MTMLAGVVIGHFLRNGKKVENIEKTTSITIFVLLFVLGLSVGSNKVIIENMGHFGWQAAVLAVLGMSGSIVAARIVYRLFFKKGEERNENSITVIAIFIVGCVAGACYDIEFDIHNLSLCILYALMLQVGIGIGSNKSLRESLRHVSPKILLVPLATITGTLLFRLSRACCSVSGACSTVWLWAAALLTIHCRPY